MPKGGRRRSQGGRRPREKRRRRQPRPRKSSSNFLGIRNLARRYPIATGIVLVLLAIILFRFSFTNEILSSGEFVFWVWLVAAILFIAGILVLIAWWRNHVSMFTTRHNVRWNR